MILSFKRDMTHNYMVTESEETLPGDDYQIHMLTEYHIGGLLTCNVKKINGKGRYFYDITSRQSMENIYEKECIGAEDIRILLKGLYTALTEAKKYLLDTNRVVLEPEMIYMDIETKEPLFCYLPVYEGSIHASFAKLCEYIMRRLDQTDSRAVLLGYEIYRQSMEENYSLEKLLKQTAFEIAPVLTGDGGRTEKKNERAKNGLLQEQAVCGREEIPLWEEHKGDEQEVRPGGSDGNVSEFQSAEEENAGREAAKQKEHRTCRRKKENRRKKGPKDDRDKSLPKRVTMVLAVVLSAGAVIIAAWFWKMDMTQLGGIAFLLAALLGYGFSAESRQKKKTEEKLRRREEKADRKSVKKMENVQKAVREPHHERQQEPHREKQREPYHERRQEPHREKQREPHHEKQQESRGTKTIGATVLLDKGEAEYEPHLSLISMNPRERNSIVLLNDSYTIGKLQNKSDICIDHPSISRIHAKILREGRDYYLCDLNSTNGTFVNGRRLAINERVPIRLSDEIRFADLGYYVGRC